MATVTATVTVEVEMVNGRKKLASYTYRVSTGDNPRYHEAESETAVAMAAQPVIKAIAEMPA